ncbi:MAG: membrane protein insertion efficiency factor YidD [Bacilli bacterium]|nr:membrane protein insertion efficiency factor YidD [Bacilli bacterium]
MKHLMIGAIKLYQKIPLQMHNACRFTPTCSNYAIEAYENYGFFYGTYLTIKRLLKCRPFGKMGYDPVPRKNNMEEKL